MFVLIYPFTSQIFCISNDFMQRFTYNEKIEMTFYSIMDQSHTSEKWLELPLNRKTLMFNRRVRGRSLPWITPTIKNLMKKRDYHHKKAIKTNKELHWSS